MKAAFTFFCVLMVSCPVLFGQNADTDLSNYQLNIQMATDPIILDGNLEEASWVDASVAGDFWQQFPIDKVRANSRTEVKMTYDSENLYIAAVCYDVERYVVQTLKRDVSFFDGDGFGIIIDPVNSQTNGFFFGVSPFNVQAEDLLAPLAANMLSMSWDNRWFSAVSRLPDKYIVEIAIPFKTLRFKKDNTTWGINFIRNDLSRNQNYSWTPMPVNFKLYDIGYTGKLNWDKAPEKTGTNISLIPYATAGIVQDGETQTSRDVGIDAKVSLTSSMNLDLTVNPDFSQVDVDVQQTNLTRFNLRFPERRGFFLENDDLFTGAGPNPAKPIFTRRIGLDSENRPVPIEYGARLSGNLNPNFRIGLLNLKTKPTATSPGQNYSIGVFNQSLWARSVLKGYATNRQAQTQTNGVDKNDFGRNAGLEMNYLNASGSWNYFAGLHLSEKPNMDLGTYYQVGFERSGRNLRIRMDYWNLNKDYRSDIGFIPRLENYDAANDTVIFLGFRHLFGRVDYTFRPKDSSKKIIAHNIESRNEYNWYLDGVLSDGDRRLTYDIRYRNTSRITFQGMNTETNLLFATKFTDAEPLPIGNYNYSFASLAYSSDVRKSFPIMAEMATGQFYNGNLTRFLLQLSYRKQPWGNFSLSWEQNNLKLPFPYGSSNLTLINSRSEINFSTKMFWTTFLQYNTQRDNFNINSRLQWRYRTMSDLFLVYSYNYSMSPFIQVRQNQALIIKINYMFNI